MTTQKNGATIPTNGKKVETTVPVVTLPTNGKIKEPGQKKPEEPGQKQPEAKDLPPLEDRVLKIQQLADVIEKRDKLQQSLSDLQRIKVKGDDRSLKITIEDNNNEWETTSSPAISFCIESLTTGFKERIAALESQIHF